MAVEIWWCVLLGAGLLVGLAAWRLRPEDLSAFDGPLEGTVSAPFIERFSTGPEPSAQLRAVEASLATLGQALRGSTGRQRIAALRRHIDSAFTDRVLDATFTPVDCAGVPAEWVLAPGADGSRRTLYLHGGGFIIGSPRSHRTLTSRFSALTGGAVLAVDYRLMPEHPRRAGIEDCRQAYRWMLEHGPADTDGVADRSPASTVVVAGESAGGNLTLSLLAWLRDAGLRQPDAAVALSPLTDSCLASPSLRRNRHSDVMLGPMLGQLVRLPGWLLQAMTWLQTRIDPRDALISPLRGELHGLPPLLLQASEAEMLLDDVRRYAHRARAAGSPVRLQTWRHPVHAWPIFNPELPEAEEALAQIGRFLAEVAPPSGLPRTPDRAAASHASPA
jgi:acetyl esterase/lipase